MHGQNVPDFSNSFLHDPHRSPPTGRGHWHKGIVPKTRKYFRPSNYRIYVRLCQVKKDLPETKLKEFVGHTPLQVVMGALLGLFIAVIMYSF